jgi:3',5'-cyclic-AMP phosphodiesterase
MNRLSIKNIILSSQNGSNSHNSHNGHNDHNSNNGNNVSAASGNPDANGLSRRGFMKTLTAGGAGLALFGGCTTAQAVRRDADFTFLHMTDMHVRRKRKGHEGYRACIESVKAMERTPDFSLMGGDLAFDGLYNEKDEFADQIELYKTISDSMDIPYYNCIGNHDVLGLNSRRKVPVDDPDIGHKMIMDRLGMDRSYYSFDHGGWHFVVLDTIHRVETEHGPSYEARLGEEQLEWLRFDLGAAGGRPTVCLMHIAAFCNIGQINADPNLPSMNHMVIADNLPFRHILERHNVKAVLQGHSHQIEDFYFNGIWYITSQSVSAAWWGGNWRGFYPGYTVLETRGEELSWYRREFDWEHQLEPEDDLERERIRQREEFLQEQERLRAEEINVEVKVSIKTPSCRAQL